MSGASLSFTRWEPHLRSPPALAWMHKRHSGEEGVGTVRVDIGSAGASPRGARPRAPSPREHHVAAEAVPREVPSSSTSMGQAPLTTVKSHGQVASLTGGRRHFLLALPRAAVRMLPRVLPLVAALVALCLWRQSLSTNRSTTANMAGRLAEAEARLDTWRDEARAEAARVARDRRTVDVELARARTKRLAAERRLEACEATVEELRSELDAGERTRTVVEKGKEKQTGAGTGTGMGMRSDPLETSVAGRTDRVPERAKILAARDALLSLGQALYSNVPATFLPRQASAAAVAAAAAADRASRTTCPSFDRPGAAGFSPSSRDEHDVAALVRKTYVFHNPGRPSDDERNGGLNGAAAKGAAAGVDYSHMAMISRLPKAALWSWIVVWQAANVKEGEPDQHFLCAFSDDAVTWTDPVAMPLGKQRGAIPWSPVLHLAPDGENLVIFFAESTTCRRPGRAPGWPQRWAPGGDIRLATSKDGFRWSKRVAVLSQQIGGNVPKVIANPAVALRSGALLLPYWEEVPRLTEEEEGCPLPGAEPNAGALVSGDGGRTWEPSAGLQDDDTWLIEGTAAELNDGRVLMLFRTSVGKIYRSVSNDGGNTWSKAVSTGMPNPNSKFHLLRLVDGTLALAYNHHDRSRTNLFVALSSDGGSRWHLAARVEDGTDPDGAGQLNQGVMAAYPTMYQDGCRLLVTYSIMERRAWMEIEERAAGEANAGGIKIAEVDLSEVVMTDANEINTGEDAVKRPLVSMPPDPDEGVVEVDEGLTSGEP